MPIPEAGQPPRYTGAADCVTKTVKLEGIKGLYKGMSSNLYSTSSQSIINQNSMRGFNYHVIYIIIQKEWQLL